VADALHTHGTVVSAQDARLDDAGLIAPQTSTLDVRTGVMLAPGATSLVTGTTSTAPMTVTIAPHHWVTSRGTANGPYRGALEGARTVNIATAPGANSRMDVVWVRQADATPGVPSQDATTGEEYGVTTGTPGVSPTRPALPVGAVELATVTVAAGAANTLGAGVTIAQTARLTNTRGGPIVCRTVAERNALTGYLGGEEVLVLATGMTYKHDGTRWRFIRYLGPRGNAPTVYYTRGGLSVPNNSTAFVTGWTAVKSHPFVTVSGDTFTFQEAGIVTPVARMTSDTDRPGGASAVAMVVSNQPMVAEDTRPRNVGYPSAGTLRQTLVLPATYVEPGDTLRVSAFQTNTATPTPVAVLYDAYLSISLTG
jgi:hypothetical protein